STPLIKNGGMIQLARQMSSHQHYPSLSPDCHGCSILFPYKLQPVARLLKLSFSIPMVSCAMRAVNTARRQEQAKLPPAGNLATAGLYGGISILKQGIGELSTSYRVSEGTGLRTGCACPTQPKRGKRQRSRASQILMPNHPVEPTPNSLRSCVA